MIKLNNLLSSNNITAYGFGALVDYAATSNRDSDTKVVVSSLSPAIMAEQGITTYYALALPRGLRLNTAADVFDADLEVSLVTVFSVSADLADSMSHKVIVSGPGRFSRQK